MLNKEELEILSKYPLYQIIPIEDYVCDFVLKNPLNYPITSIILSKSEDTFQLNFSDLYKRDTIKKLYRKYLNGTYHYLYRIEDCKNLTSLLILFQIQSTNHVDEIFFTILKRIDDDFIIAIKSDKYNYTYIFDTDYKNGIICVDNNGYSIILNELMNHNIDFNNLSCNSYVFPTDIYECGKTKEDYFNRFEMMARYVTGYKDIVLSNETLWDKYIKVVEYRLISYMENYTNPVSVNEAIRNYFKESKKINIKPVYHPETIDANELLNKKVAISGYK
jgi:hypothetical protein